MTTLFSIKLQRASIKKRKLSQKFVEIQSLCHFCLFMFFKILTKSDLFQVLQHSAQHEVKNLHEDAQEQQQQQVLDSVATALK